MESSGSPMTTPQLEIPPHPKMPRLNEPGALERWQAELAEWQAHPAVVADRIERARAETERVESMRPHTDCVECQVERSEGGFNPWAIVYCGPHKVSELVNRAAGSPTAYRPVPVKYRDADPRHVIPELRKWDASRSLYLTGPVGTGKTYQAAALVRRHYLELERPRGSLTADDVFAGAIHSRPVVWANVPKLLEELRRSFDAPERAPKGLEIAPLLVLDDIGAEKPSEWVEERLYCIVNERYESGLPIIVTSNLTPAKLGQRLGARLTSRLAEMCDVFGLGGKDRRLGAA